MPAEASPQDSRTREQPARSTPERDGWGHLSTEVGSRGAAESSATEPPWSRYGTGVRFPDAIKFSTLATMSSTVPVADTLTAPRRR